MERSCGDASLDAKSELRTQKGAALDIQIYGKKENRNLFLIDVKYKLIEFKEKVRCSGRIYTRSLHFVVHVK